MSDDIEVTAEASSEGEAQAQAAEAPQQESSYRERDRDRDGDERGARKGKVFFRKKVCRFCSQRCELTTRMPTPCAATLRSAAKSFRAESPARARSTKGGLPLR